MSDNKTSVLHNSSMSKQLVTVNIPELFDPIFLDTLLPAQVATKEEVVDASASTSNSHPANPMMDALQATTSQTLTANLAPAYDSTGDDVLDAFQFLNQDSYGQSVNHLLEKSWAKDPDLTLRIIWNLRSIHDGKSQKEVFYRAYGWLLENHPRTAIQNLPQLVEPVCTLKKDGEPTGSHGYWKDLLNILCLATTDELANIETPSAFLHPPRYAVPTKTQDGEGGKNRARRLKWKRPPPVKEDATVVSKKRLDILVENLKESKFKALYIATARLFAERLSKDLTLLHKANSIKDEEEKFEVLKQISLAAKWAPTPGGLHDKHTNISTAIAILLPDFQAPVEHFPSILHTQHKASREVAVAMRQYLQKWFLTPLREVTHVTETRMSANRWDDIKYSRVPSICMQKNVENFYNHDPEGLEQYLLAVEQGKKSISGATLMPHQIIAEVLRLNNEASLRNREDVPVQKKVKAKLADTELRVAESQWKTLVNRLRDAGSIDNSIAVCDVSGSMGFIGSQQDSKHPSPILPAISLSLLLATLSKPPFNGGFITFSANPEFVQLDLQKPLATLVREMGSADWGMNTDLNAVFTKLILPLAVKNKIKQEDMIKRVFIFTDMQFDAGASTRNDPANWATNYDAIKEAYEKEGYSVPEIVYWDLAGYGTVDAKAETTGVAMMNGFSSAMLKVFMGEQDEEWMDVTEDGETQTAKEEFNPVQVMKKALMKKSFDGLVVGD